MHFVAGSRVVTLDHENRGWHREGDELINDAEEEKIKIAKKTSIPSKLRAVIKFGYEEGMKNALLGQDFDSWIDSVFTHTRAHFMHESLGTKIMFEVC